MNIFKKIMISSGKKEELKSYETWSVRWTSRYGSYYNDTTPEMELFKTKEEAGKFACELEQAFKITKNLYENKVKVNKNV